MENYDLCIITLGIDVVNHEQESGTLDALQIQLLHLCAIGRPWLKLSGYTFDIHLNKRINKEIAVLKLNGNGLCQQNHGLIAVHFIPLPPAPEVKFSRAQKAAN